MKVRIQFFSHLKDVVGSSTIEEELPANATVSALLEKLYARYPKLRDWDRSLLIGAGVEFVSRDYILQPTDQVAIMPPVQGG